MVKVKPEAYSDAVHVMSEIKKSLQPISVIISGIENNAPALTIKVLLFICCS